MASSDRRKFSVRHPVVVDVGCSCRRTRSLVSLFTQTATRKPKLNPETPPNHHHPLSSYYPFSPSTTNFSTSHNHSSSSNTITSTTTSPHEEYKCSSSPFLSTSAKKPPPTVTKKKKKTHVVSKDANPKGRGVVKESVAVVKESDDPYHDFRESMLQMITEKDIYAWDDLRELLHRFLSLNSPYHHDSILRAFTEIWDDLFHAGKRGSGVRRKKKHQQRQQLGNGHPTYTRQPMHYDT